MLTRTIFHRSAPLQLDRTRHLLHEVVEELAPQFEGEYTRADIRRQAAETALDLPDTLRSTELRQIVTLVTTYRLAARLKASAWSLAG